MLRVASPKSSRHRSSRSRKCTDQCSQTSEASTQRVRSIREIKANTGAPEMDSSEAATASTPAPRRCCRMPSVASWPEMWTPWSTIEELRKILRIYPRASGTVYVTHYANGFTQKEMVHTPVLFCDAPEDNAQVELRHHNPFASRSIVTSTATLPTQG